MSNKNWQKATRTHKSPAKKAEKPFARTRDTLDQRLENAESAVVITTYADGQQTVSVEGRDKPVAGQRTASQIVTSLAHVIDEQTNLPGEGIARILVGLISVTPDLMHFNHRTTPEDVRGGIASVEVLAETGMDHIAKAFEHMITHLQLAIAQLLLTDATVEQTEEVIQDVLTRLSAISEIADNSAQAALKSLKSSKPVSLDLLHKGVTEEHVARANQLFDQIFEDREDN